MKSINFYFFLVINLLLTKVSLGQGDDCYSAITLSNVTNYCSNTAIYTNVGSTASGLANATCWTGAATSDVWFSFTATGTDILISANGSGFGGTMSRPRIALYFGTCSTTSTTVNQLGCNNGTAGSGFTQLYVGGLILGQTYLIRISSTSANVGTFELCANNFTPPPSAGADCGGASQLCNKNSLSVSGLNGGGLDPDEPTNEVNSCMTGSFLSSAETNSAWYTWTCGTSGNLLFDIIPSNLSNDIDFVLYQLNSANPCGVRTIIRCNTASCLNAASSTGLNATDTDISEQPGCAVGANAYCQQINMVAGTSYALLINNADGTSGFSLNWGGTGTFLGPNPNIVASDTTICVGETVVFDGSTSTNSTSYNWSFNGNGAPVNISGVGPHSITYPNVGTYVAILQTTSSLGCSSTEFKNIVVSPATSLSVTSTPICSGGSSTLIVTGATNYTWSPTTNLSSSTGSVVVANPNSTSIYSVIGDNGSCTATVNSTVNVSSNPTLTVNSGSICSGSSLTLTASGATNYTWSPTTNLSSAAVSVVVANPNSTTIYSVIGANGSCTATANSTVNVNSNPILTVNSGSICSGSSLTLTANGATNYTWSPTTNLSSSTGSVVVTNPNTTTVYSVIGANGSCTATVNSTVNVTTTPTLVVNSGNICSGSSLTLTASGALNYSWSPTTNLSSSTGSVVVANPNTTTVYSVIGANGSCTATANSTVNVNSNPTLTVNSGSICSGSSLTFTANGATNYTWSPTTNLSSSNGSVVIANPNSTTIYSVIGANGSCTASINSTLNILASPTITVNSSTICSGQTATLSAFGASNYTWSPSFTISNPNTSSTTATPALTTIYNVIGSTGNTSFLCTSSNTVQVTVIPVPTITVSPQIVICEGQSATIYAAGANTYTWSPTIGLTNPFGASTNLNPTGSGTFIYTVTAVNNNCATTETVEVIVNPLPIINAGPDAIINFDNTLVLFGTGNTNVGFISTDGIPLSCNYCYSLTVNPQNNTCYTLEGINNFGCRITDDICVTVTKDWDVFIPNAFTPNGDKNNELFIPVGYGITEMRLTIFDRWGHLVFKSNGETIGWDGKKNGQLCEQGVYIYQAEITSLSGTNLKKTGHVTLLTRVK